MRALGLVRGDERGDVVALRRDGQHRRALGGLPDDEVIEDDVLERVDDLPLELVADDLIDLARVGEGQLHEAHRELVARDGQVRRRLARLREALAHGLGLALGERGVARGHGRLHEPAQRRRAEAHLEEGELHRERAEIDATDDVRHGVTIPRASIAGRRPLARRSG